MKYLYADFTLSLLPIERYLQSRVPFDRRIECERNRKWCPPGLQWKWWVRNHWSLFVRKDFPNCGSVNEAGLL